MSYHAYQPPYQAPAAHYPPQPPSDPFRAYYADRLRELTFNSRPIIQELSVMAMQQRDQGSWAGMRAVVEEIEAAVARVGDNIVAVTDGQAHPQCKLPLLYLIDSISKNVGPPYTTELLPPVIPRLYIRAYREVDGVTRSKMDEMISLWRTSGPNASELYGPSVREGIERELYGSVRGVPVPQYQMQRPVIPAPPPANPYITTETVSAVLNTTLDAKNRDCIARPYDGPAREQLGVLLRIRDLLGSGRLTQDELHAIMKQLRDMGSTAPAPVSVPTAQPVAFTPQPSYSTLQTTVSPPAPKLPPFPPSLPHDAYRAPPPMPHPHQAQASTLPPPAAPAPISAPAPIIPLIPANVADILRNLNTAGLLSAPRTPDLPAPTLKPEPRTPLDEYEDTILNLGLKLTSIDLNTYVQTVSLANESSVHTLPLTHLPHRCLQCGMRFSTAGAKMQDHMDWHFRRNRKERETEGRGAHRRWLPRASEWINDLSSPEAGPSTQNSITEKQALKLTAERIASLQKKWVRVPTDSTKAGQPCPICKEAFKGEWSEEEEEWVWKNAMEIGNKIYHATCRAEQMNSKVAARLLGDGKRTSKSPRGRSTPPAVAAPTGEAVVKVEMGAGMGVGLGKRKAEEGGENGKRVKVDGGDGASLNGGDEVKVHGENGVEVDAGDGLVVNGVNEQEGNGGDMAEPEVVDDHGISTMGITENRVAEQVDGAGQGVVPIEGPPTGKTIEDNVVPSISMSVHHKPEDQALQGRTEGLAGVYLSAESVAPLPGSQAEVHEVVMRGAEDEEEEPELDV